MSGRGDEMQTRVRRHVEDFLLPIDARGGVARIAEEIVAAAARDCEARRAVITLAEWRSRELLDRDSRRLYRRVALRRPSLTSSEDSADTTLLAVTHLRATEELRGRGVGPSFLARVPRGLLAAADMVQGLEPDFVGKLLVESELRASRDLHFAARLDAAVEDLRWLLPQVAPLAGELAALITQDARESAGDAEARVVRATRTIDDQVGAALILSAYVVGIAIGKLAAS